MRELKFRAWSNENNRYCDFVTLDESRRWIGWIMSSGVYLTTIDINLEQYTGLKDKNGKEIYEGDIMIFDACLYKVVWNEEYAGFDYETIGEWGVTSTNVFNEGAVVGNIHENADLLGEK